MRVVSLDVLCSGIVKACIHWTVVLRDFVRLYLLMCSARGLCPVITIDVLS